MDARNPFNISHEIALNPKYRDSESALLHALLQATDTGILMSGLDRQDIIANRRMGELFSVTPQEIVELDPISTRKIAYEKVRNPEAFTELLDKTYSDPELTFKDEIELLRDPPVILSRFTGPVCNADGQAIARLWTFQDITETKLLQKEIQAQLTGRTSEFQETSAILQAINALCRLTIEHASTHETLSATLNIVRNLLQPEYIALLMTNQSEGKYEGFEREQGAVLSEVYISIDCQDMRLSTSYSKDEMFRNLETCTALRDRLSTNNLDCPLHYAHLTSVVFQQQLYND